MADARPFAGPITPEMARIRDIQDAMLEAVRRTPRIPRSAIEQARDDELARMAELAKSIGVDPEDYRKWGAGADMPHVKAAVLKANK